MRAVAADRAIALDALNVSRETVARLDVFVALLLQWQSRINLIASSTIDHVWTRHVLDSAQLLNFAPQTALRWVDLGSGGGLPGLIVASLGADRIGFEMILVESDQRKAAFLRTAAREMGLSDRIVIRAERAEIVIPSLAHVDVVSARAVAPLGDLARLSAPLLARGALGVFPKGESVTRELTRWGPPGNFDVSLAPSRTHPSAAIALIRMRAT